MSKYQPLWDYIKNNYNGDFQMSFEQAESILKFRIDHSFLSYKKELNGYGFSVEKISMKQNVIYFVKI